MAKCEERYFASKKERRKFCDRKGFLKSKINKRPRHDDARYSSKIPCIKDCASCYNNITCTKLPYI